MGVKKVPALIVALTVGATAFITGVGPAGDALAVQQVPPPPISFSSPRVVDPIHAYGEPDIRIAPDGSVFASGPWGTGTQRSIWNRSVDGGWTFLPMHLNRMQTVAESSTLIPGPGGGDTELSIDRANHVYYADLAALASYKVTRWDDTTRTMAPPGFVGDGTQNANGFDRQWFGLWDPTATQAAVAGYTGPRPVNYLLFAEALLGSSCSSGSCESATYSTNGTSYSSTTASYNQDGDGPVVVDPKTGKVIEAIGYDDSHVGIAVLSRNPDHPNNPALTRVRRVQGPAMPQGMDYNTSFPVVAIDRNRTIYLAWVTKSDKSTAQDGRAWQVYYSYATAASNWTNFTQPRRVSTPGRAPATTNTMPWIAAGTRGRIAIVSYGTTDITHNPSTEDNHQPWDVYLQMIRRADTQDPRIQETKVTRHPMHYGTICLAGLGCIAQAGNRNLADFFEVIPDPKTGAVTIVYDDTGNFRTQSIVPTQSVPNSPVDHSGAPLVVVAKQNHGVGLFGTLVQGPDRLGTSIGDRLGDAAFDPIYANNNIDQLDLKRVSVRSRPGTLILKVRVRSLTNIADAIQQVGGVSLQYVVRWNGNPVKLPKGIKAPQYYAQAEVTPDGTQTYSTGFVHSVDLCSVSGCTPHAFEYPSPPLGGHTIQGRMVITPRTDVADYFVLKVPRKIVHANPRALLQSVAAYSFGRPRTSRQPPTNDEAQGDVMPVEIDGICCKDAKLSN